MEVLKPGLDGTQLILCLNDSKVEKENVVSSTYTHSTDTIYLGCFPPLTTSLTPPGYPTIQLNLDTLPAVSIRPDPTEKGSVPQDCFRPLQMPIAVSKSSGYPHFCLT